jgi:hypothetical protein
MPRLRGLARVNLVDREGGVPYPWQTFAALPAPISLLGRERTCGILRCLVYFNLVRKLPQCCPLCGRVRVRVRVMVRFRVSVSVMTVKQRMPGLSAREEDKRC